MTTYVNPDSIFEDLPKNDHIYVVTNFGQFSINRHLATDIPIVDVYLKKVINGKLSTKEEICYLGLPELTVVRIGTIWHNQRQLSGQWKEYTQPYEDQKHFTFDLLNNKADSVFFAKDISTNGSSLKIIPFEEAIKSTKYDLHHSSFTKLLSNDGIMVIVPSIEFLISTYVPKNQLIRNALIMAPIDTVLQNFTEAVYPENEKYVVELESLYEKETMCFLAYLGCNSLSRANISKLWNSLTLSDPLSKKHPMVLPYHPSEISFNASGLWLNDNLFFAQRLYKTKTPNDVPLKILRHTKAAYSHENKKIPSIPINKNSIHNQTKITRTMSPSPLYGTKYIVSEVAPDSENLEIEIEEILDGVKEAEIYQKDTPNVSTNVISPGKFSSASDSTGIGRVQFGNKKTIATISLPLMQEIETILEKLKNTQQIEVLNYIDDNADEHDSLIYCSFDDSHINLNENKFWASGYIKGSQIKKSKSGYRKLLIVKITKKDMQPFYLLEIGRKAKSEHYYGVFFNPPNEKLILQELLDIKNVIASNKGRFDGSGFQPFPIKRAVNFRHIWGAMEKRFLNAFEILKTKNILETEKISGTDAHL